MNSYPDKIRKSWLLSLWIISLWSLLLIILGVLELEASVGEKILGLSIFTLIILALAYATYHVAYKKSGTKWLTFLVIVIPLRIIIDLGQLGWNGEAELMLFYIILAIPEIYFWINSLYLRGLNSKMNNDQPNT